MRYDDIIFLSYNEENAEENFQRLLDVVPHGGIGRVHGVKGILEAHRTAAEKAKTDWLYVVDGDNWVLEDFKFDFEPVDVSKESTFVWRAKNPLNGLVYGYGGIKYFNRKVLLSRLDEMKIFRVDLTTSLFKNMYPVQILASETRFNTSPFSTWKGAFRECAKLASKTIARQKDQETEERLNVWLTVAEGNYAEYALKGAKAGKEFGSENKNNFKELGKINDFEWLKKRFVECFD